MQRVGRASVIAVGIGVCAVITLLDVRTAARQAPTPAPAAPSTSQAFMS